MPTQITLQVPFELGMGNGTAPFTVMVNGPAAKGTRAGSPVNGTFSNTVLAPVGQTSPGIYYVSRADGGAGPVSSGDLLVVLANGLGRVEGGGWTGARAPVTSTVNTLEKPVVTIGGLDAEVLFAGLAPGMVGVYQLNVRVPFGVQSGMVSLVIGAGGAVSQGFGVAMQ